jgi:hypothetical protein
MDGQGCAVFGIPLFALAVVLLVALVSALI